MTPDTETSQQQLSDLISSALKAGADAADALLVNEQSISVAWHGGKLESLEYSESGDLGLRVLFGKKQAVVSTTDRSAKMLTELVERAVAMAKAAPEDPFCGIADAQDISRDYPKLELADDYEIDVPTLIARAWAAEDAALAVKGVAQCESTDASGGQTSIVLAASNGFSGAYQRTHYSISASVLAGQDTEMEHDYDYASVVFQSDLPAPATIGHEAALRAVRCLGARKMSSCQAPVVFDPRVANNILYDFIGAILGNGIARGTSFLKDHLGKQVFAKDITVIDDPFRPRGLSSKAFDAEGIIPMRRKLVEDGVLTTWLMDLRSARQLGMKSTGHARRGAGGMPSPAPTNCYLEAGKSSATQLVQDIKNGFYVTELMGMGVNDVTGDFSQAAKGFWIENGIVTFPVNEMTIAGNLKDMFMHLTAADDLVFRYGIDAPTLRIENMTIAGL